MLSEISFGSPGMIGLRLLTLLACALALLAACSTDSAAPEATPTGANVAPSAAAPANGDQPPTRLGPAQAPSEPSGGAQPTATRARPTPTSQSDDGELVIRTVLPRDAIPSIDDPEFLDAEQASELMSDGHLVIGLSIGDDHRAYSTAFLSGHEIVNDTVGGMPVAVTW